MSCIDCEIRHQIILALLNYYTDADPVVMMDLLVEQLTNPMRPLNSDEQREVSALHGLLSIITKTKLSNMPARLN